MNQTTRAVNYLLAAFIATLFAPVIWAAESAGKERWFEVELLIFAQPKSETANKEFWPSDITLEYPKNWVELKNPNSASIDLRRDAFYLLPDKAHKLTAEKMQLRWSKAHRPLLHEAWRQPVFDKNNAPSILIHAGRQYDDHRELEGSIQLSVSRYLHLQTNLWFTEFARNTDDSVSPRPNRVTRIQQKRRMRSKDLHYIDHPLVGILILITPYKQR